MLKLIPKDADLQGISLEIRNKNGSEIAFSISSALETLDKQSDTTIQFDSVTLDGPDYHFSVRDIFTLLPRCKSLILHKIPYKGKIDVQQMVPPVYGYINLKYLRIDALLLHYFPAQHVSMLNGLEKVELYRRLNDRSLVLNFLSNLPRKQIYFSSVSDVEGL